jgi:hypothetical protein
LGLGLELELLFSLVLIITLPAVRQDAAAVRVRKAARSKD